MIDAKTMTCPICGQVQPTDAQAAGQPPCPRCGWDFPVFLGTGEEARALVRHRLDEAHAHWRGRRRRIGAIDIGGSGVKAALFEGTLAQPGRLQLLYEPVQLIEPDWNAFGAWLVRQLPAWDLDRVGVSAAGFVDASSGTVLFSRVTGWQHRPIVQELGDCFGGIPVALLNDAEAHLAACLGDYPNPLISLALGTSVGFGLSTAEGTIGRPRPDVNYDIGEWRLATRATDPHVWWALGAPGLDELQRGLGRERGARHYGARLGAFLVSLCSVFRPHAVVLSGGIVETYGESLLESAAGEFAVQQPDWLDAPQLVLSPWGTHAALYGAARHALISA